MLSEEKKCGHSGDGVDECKCSIYRWQFGIVLHFDSTVEFNFYPDCFLFSIKILKKRPDKKLPCCNLS